MNDEKNRSTRPMNRRAERFTIYHLKFTVYHLPA